MKTMRMALTIILMIVMASAVHAELMVGISCPDTVYSHEIFTCKTSIYNNGARDANIAYRVHFAEEKFTLLSADLGRFTVPSYQIIQREFNAWARDEGSDVFLFEYGPAGDTDSVAGKRVVAVKTPLYLEMPRIKVPAGRRTTVHLALRGSGDSVSIYIHFPPGIYGTREVNVGDVSGTAELNVQISTDPYYVGTVTVPVDLRFSDRRGTHLEQYTMVLEVSPSLSLIAAGIAVLGVIVGAAYLLLKRFLNRRGGESDS